MPGTSITEKVSGIYLMSMSKNNLKIFLVILFVPLLLLKAEYPDSTISKIKVNQELITQASRIFNIDPNILSSIIYVERTQNYTWEDDALDEYLAQVGLNSSIGFCQVKLKTAYWIEVQLNDSLGSHYIGDKYFEILKFSKSPKEIISKLQNDSLNILYAAAYLKIIQTHWQKDGFPIDDRADILGTLYSTGLFYRGGEERKPNKNPKANWFGKLTLNAQHLFN